MTYQKPISVKTHENHPYWDAADKHELVLQTCTTCQSYQHPPGPACSKCGGTELNWGSQGSDVKGSLYSYVVSYRPFLPGFQDDLPTIIAIVELDNVPNVKIIGNILECSPADVKIGMPLKMVWQDITEERALPQWMRV